MRVGFIGLGMMGKGMAANLQKAGHQLVVYDLNRAAAEPFLAKGAEWANSPRQVAAASEVVFTSLPVPADVEAVALGPNGLIEGMKPDTAFFDMSTNSVAVVRKINAAFAEKNLYMLDSPVSGGPSGAASGKMAIWVGGDEQQFNRHKSVLDAMGDQARYIGPIGAGTIAKLVHNCTSAVVGVALAEVMTMGIKAGVEPLELWEAVRQGATGRQRTFDRLGKFLTSSYDPADFALRLLHKDVSLAVGLGKEVGGADAARQSRPGRTDRSAEPRLGPARQPGFVAAAGRALRHSDPECRSGESPGRARRRPPELGNSISSAIHGGMIPRCRRPSRRKGAKAPSRLTMRQAPNAIGSVTAGPSPCRWRRRHRHRPGRCRDVAAAAISWPHRGGIVIRDRLQARLAGYRCRCSYSVLVVAGHPGAAASASLPAPLSLQAAAIPAH